MPTLRITRKQYLALRELYNEFKDAFDALPDDYREAFWACLYQPALILPEE